AAGLLVGAGADGARQEQGRGRGRDDEALRVHRSSFGVCCWPFDARPPVDVSAPGSGTSPRGAASEPVMPDVQFHILSFEGPDRYPFAGGIASRISGLAETLADLGHETHLWFVGDPELQGHETRTQLTLHRWCQWISRFHPNGVYDGEEGKQSDYARS